MLQRVITSLVGLCVVVPALIFSGTVFFPILCSIGAVIAAYEVCACFGKAGKWFYLIPAFLYSAAMPLLQYFLRDSFPDFSSYIRIFGAAAFGLLLVYFAAIVFCGGREKFSVAVQIATCTVYETLGFTALVSLRLLPQGEYIFLLVFLGAWITDIMAYFTGRFLGKHKLSPAISPKKTVEGSIGGTVFCVGAFALYGFLVERFAGIDAGYVSLLIAGLVLSLLSQIGDLALSLLKREVGIKDFGNILPGHGGILDRCDSMLMIAPVLLTFCTFSGYTFFVS